jgi:hypothetical protein
MKIPGFNADRSHDRGFMFTAKAAPAPYGLVISGASVSPQIHGDMQRPQQQVSAIHDASTPGFIDDKRTRAWGAIKHVTKRYKPCGGCERWFLGRVACPQLSCCALPRSVRCYCRGARAGCLPQRRGCPPVGPRRDTTDRRCGPYPSVTARPT